MSLPCGLRHSDVAPISSPSWSSTSRTAAPPQQVIWEQTNEPSRWATKTTSRADILKKKQSPINIDIRSVQQDPQLLEHPLSWKYVPKNSNAILNTGEGWKVTVEGQESCLTGGPLQHCYQLTQFHCHWGRFVDCGSEHSVDETFYPGELHLVHWNVDLCNSVDEAVSCPKGLAVVGIFLQVGKQHMELMKITEALHEIIHKGDESTFSEEFNPSLLFPDDKEYWTYEGSLTTHPFHESVTWILFKNPIEVSEDQISKFRTLCARTKEESNSLTTECIFENRRKIQNLNGRIVRAAPF